MRNIDAEARRLLGAGGSTENQEAVPATGDLHDLSISNWEVGSPTSDPELVAAQFELGRLHDRHSGEGGGVLGDLQGLKLERIEHDIRILCLDARWKERFFTELETSVNKALSDYWRFGLEPTGTFQINLPSHAFGFAAPIDANCGDLINEFCKTYSRNNPDLRITVVRLREPSNYCIRPNRVEITVVEPLHRERHWIEPEPAGPTWKDFFFVTGLPVA